MKIAIIDDGIAINSIPFRLTSYKVENNIVVPVSKNKTSTNSHGTICAQIITQNLFDAEIISIAIYEELLDGKEEDLVAALSWCLEHHVDLINLSNGATGYFDNQVVNELCFKIRCSGTIIVAAVSNDWEYTAPACLPYVIGASKRKMLSRDLIFADKELNGFHLFRDRKGKLKFESHNSIACARLSNRVALQHEFSLFKKAITITPKIFDFSLLLNVYVWGTNEKIIKESFAFRFKHFSEYSSNEKEKITLLVIDERNTEELYKVISTFADNILLVIWCNTKVPRRIKKACVNKGIRLWSPHKKRKTIFNRCKEIVEPFSIAYDPESISIEEIAQFKNELSKLGYNVLAFSSQEFSFLYGFIYEGCSRLIKKLTDCVVPDVAIIEASGNRCAFAWDIKISRTQSKLHISTPNESLGEYDSFRTVAEALTMLFSDEE